MRPTETMTLDEMLIIHESRKLEPKDRYPHYWLICVGLWVCTAVGGMLDMWPLLYGCSVVLMWYCTRLTIKETRRFHQLCQWDAELDHKIDEVPYHKRRLAQELTSDITEAHLWAIECHEAHLPGDCPLCGAV